MKKSNVTLKGAKKLNREDQRKVFGGAISCPAGFYATTRNGVEACCPRNGGPCFY
ncbi:hypothetical protein [Chryseobacterium piperi]|uniref:hypothetical protein n=1 Tax=Chryseobacterium piperi TaxID=558152 RepID=UPI000AD85402|nr:hypothetical protein [Chryseobacterium piperi]